MRNPLSTTMHYIGIMSGTFTGTLIDLLGLASTLTPPDHDTSQGELLTALGSVILVAIPTLLIRPKLEKKYEESPKKEFSSAFLLYSSFGVLTFVLDKLIVTAYEPSLGALNLPMAIAGGASAVVMTGLGVLSRERTPRAPVTITQSSSSFFHHDGDNPNHNIQNASTALLSPTSESDYAAIINVPQV